jgi:hypothetical protein
MLKHRLMSDDYQRIELITGAVRWRHFPRSRNFGSRRDQEEAR